MNKTEDYSEILKEIQEKYVHQGANNKDFWDFVESKLKTIEERAREETYLKGKLTAYENVVAWTKQCDPSNEMALSAHKAAVSQTKYELDTLNTKK